MIGRFTVVEPERRAQRRERGRGRRDRTEQELLRALPNIFADLPAELQAIFIVPRLVNPTPNTGYSAGFGGCLEGWIG